MTTSRWKVLSELQGQSHDAIHCLGALTIDMEDGDLKHPGDVGGVLGRPTLLRRRG